METSMRGGWYAKASWGAAIPTAGSSHPAKRGPPSNGFCCTAGPSAGGGRSWYGCGRAGRRACSCAMLPRATEGCTPTCSGRAAMLWPNAAPSWSASSRDMSPLRYAAWISRRTLMLELACETRAACAGSNCGPNEDELCKTEGQHRATSEGHTCWCMTAGFTAWLAAYEGWTREWSPRDALIARGGCGKQHSTDKSLSHVTVSE